MKIFGKQIGIVAVLMLLVIGVGSAAVVSYLSNDVEADVAVSSPFTMEFKEIPGGTWSQDDLTLSDKVGGETSTFRIRCTNNANQDIEMQIETLITCDARAEYYAGNLPWGNVYDIDHADFEDDGNHGLDDVKYGITVEFLYGHDPVNCGCPIPVNFHPMTYDRGTTLAMVGGAAEDSSTPPVKIWPQVFPKNSYTTIEVCLHHAPNAVGNYTITSEVQDDSAGWVP